MSEGKQQARSTEFLQHCFFIYDDWGQDEKAEEEDFILYFYPPSVPLRSRIFLQGAFSAMINFANNFTNWPLEVLCLERSKAAIHQVGPITMVLTAPMDEPDKSLIAHLNMIFKAFLFYNRSFKFVLENVEKNLAAHLHHPHTAPQHTPRTAKIHRKELLEEMGRIGRELVPLITTGYHRNPLRSFNPIPYTPLPHKANRTFIQASQLLQAIKGSSGYLGACILYKSGVVCTHLDLMTTRCILNRLEYLRGTPEFCHNPPKSGQPFIDITPVFMPRHDVDLLNKEKVNLGVNVSNAAFNLSVSGGSVASSLYGSNTNTNPILGNSVSGIFPSSSSSSASSSGQTTPLTISPSTSQNSLTNLVSNMSISQNSVNINNNNVSNSIGSTHSSLPTQSPRPVLGYPLTQSQAPLQTQPQMTSSTNSNYWDEEEDTEGMVRLGLWTIVIFDLALAIVMSYQALSDKEQLKRLRLSTDSKLNTLYQELESINPSASTSATNPTSSASSQQSGTGASNSTGPSSKTYQYLVYDDLTQLATGTIVNSLAAQQANAAPSSNPSASSSQSGSTNSSQNSITTSQPVTPAPVLTSTESDFSSTASKAHATFMQDPNISQIILRDSSGEVFCKRVFGREVYFQPRPSSSSASNLSHDKFLESVEKTVRSTLRDDHNVSLL
eukprot:TRINITY_DN1671_c0_g1_i4.p1 TRINITY_DN1671_c0_g1~~TRINITY_DN1671_c0_g1_i4.p1  ORF type:complete len:668 (+),score=122.64 TRINITY_DN1671_c0_g1_i4:69-2072(+)